MRKLTKTLAALLLMLAVVVAAGCKKPDDPTDPNNPNNGGGGNGGGNGGGETPTTEGIYLGIIGFNYNLFPKEIGFLDNTTKSSFTSFIDNLTTENLTALYYADYAALKNLNLYSEPPRLTNVALVTFTDGLDNASLDDDERNPENYPTRDAYLNALHSKIKTEKIHGLDVNAYTIGLRGNDVHDVVAFQNNLKKLASDDQNVFEVTSMDEALQHFEEIAESLHWTSVTTSLTLLVPPGYDDGMVLRFTFDQGNSAANSALCIECTYKRGDNVRRLENIQYIGFEQGASSLSSVEKLPNGFYKFVFEQLEKKNGQGYITEDDRNRMKLYRRISTGWEPETEFDNSNQSSIVNEQNSALIMLVLDCTTSLGSQFSSLKVGAKNFVETLVNANSGGGGLTRFTVSVSANPTEGGTVSGGGTFNSGSLRTVTATANDGYSFTNWTENGNEVSTNPNYSFTLNTNRTFVANFTATAPNQYTINVSANPTEGGSVSGGGAFNSGTSRTVTATANEGYSFTNWTENGNVVSTNANYTFTVTANRTLVANFTANAPSQYTIIVSANPAEGGTVSGGGTFNSGTSRTVTATANEGYSFTNWTENGSVVSTNANYTFTVTANRTLVANFIANAPNQYTINVLANPTDGGMVGGGGAYEQGDTCTVRTTANSGYAFINWTENGDEVSTSANYTFIVNGHRTLVANFEEHEPETYTVSVSANPSNGGTVSGGGTFQQGESCTVHADANTGYTFTNWTENGNVVSTNANYTFTVTGNRMLKANFTVQTPDTYTITAGVTPTGSGTTTGAGTYQQGQSCTLTATAASGFVFQKWTKNGSQVSTNATYTFTVTESASYIAHFDQQSYNISLSASPSNGGTVSGGGVHYYGQSCTVHAAANSGYTFTNWTENGSVVSSNANYNFTVTGNRTLVAHFTQQSQAPTGAINGKFSVSAGQRVYFSQGNLQYKASTAQWQFATNQYDYIGDANSNISQNYSGWIDLFGWGTSGWNPGNTYYRPWDSNNSDGSLYGPPGQYNLTGSYAHSDWGVHNAISNGGNAAGQWRTLTQSEWDYVFNSRSTNSGIRYAKAQVAGVNGVILLPDDWSTSYYSLSGTNQSGASFTSNVISSSAWTNSLQSHGAVFLPAAGGRNGTSVSNVGSYGHYWSAQYFTNINSMCVAFFDGGLYADSYLSAGDRYVGLSVRLVCPAE